MRRALLLGLLALGLAPAVAAAPARTIATPAPVLAVAFDGTRVAYATGRSAGDCNRVYVWNLATRGVSKLGRKTHCEQTSTGNAIAAVSVAGSRVLWTHYVGGNTREWTLWTATTSRPAPHRLRAVSTDADSPPPIVLGPGEAAAGGLLPYAVGRQVTVLRSNGSRAFTWTAPAAVTALGADGGRTVVGRADGRATILGPDGEVVRELALDGPAILAAFARGSGAALQRGRELVVYDGAGGSIEVFPLPAGARLVDADRSSALYVSRSGLVRRLSLETGGERSYGAGTSAQLEPGRVAIGSGRTVRVVPAG
jgi:hypothetical protein